MNKQKQLSQFFTPVWAAEMLFNEHFSHLTPQDLVWEPSCGPGSFLSAIPHHIPAIGSDIDPELTKVASDNTGREVYTGDFRTVNFDRLNDVTAIVGNPPFDLDIFEQFMKRCEDILKLGNKAAFILPAYFFQTSKTFMRLTRKWEVDEDLIPRDLFPGLSMPLMWATFIRDNFPKLYAFQLYAQLCDINNLKENVKELVNKQVKRTGSVWREVLVNVVKDSGGVITLNDVYDRMERKRPTDNPFWKDQIRKIIQQKPFQRVGEATYQLIQ